MAHGASAAGYKPAVAVIGDSTFTHSGVTPLLDAVTQDADMTLLILDNSAVAMTGGQKTLIESDRLVKLVKGCGGRPGTSPRRYRPSHSSHKTTQNSCGARWNTRDSR